MIPSGTRFGIALRAASIPIEGVRGNGPECEIQFLLEATEAQRQEAEQLKKDFDWRERKPKDSGTLQAEVQALAVADFDKLGNADRVASLVERLQREPDFGRKLDVTIDGDEPTS